MPATTALVVSLITLAFVIFAATLFYGQRSTRDTRS
jgi:multisubunit Na+/H+ antiporter MnhC subunit